MRYVMIAVGGALGAIAENLPIKIEFVEMPDALDALMPELLTLVKEGLVEVQDTTIVKTHSNVQQPS